MDPKIIQLIEKAKEEVKAPRTPKSYLDKANITIELLIAILEQSVK